MRNPIRSASLAALLATVATTTACPFLDDPASPPEDVWAIFFEECEGITCRRIQELAVDVGETYTLDVYLEGASGDGVIVPVTWVSSNPAIAAVPDGDGTRTYVTGVSTGTTTIRATAGSKSATIPVTVTETGLGDGILFGSTRDGNAEIYMLVLNVPLNLSQNEAADVSPAKHGDRIYFSSNRSGNFEIYSMKFDGSNVIRLTNDPLPDHHPSVSSNGLVAFVREVAPGRGQIFTMSLAGQNQANISNNSFAEGNPSWSPDGTKLAYTSDRHAKYGPGQYGEIYSMFADGSGVTRLTFNDDGIDYLSAWSPDGSKIAFTSNRAANPSNPSDPNCYNQALEIWVMNSDGSGLRNLTDHCRGDAWPAWSPSGIAIVFLSDRGTITNYAWDLWSVPSSGGVATRLTFTGKEASPAWR